MHMSDRIQESAWWEEGDFRTLAMVICLIVGFSLNISRDLVRPILSSTNRDTLGSYERHQRLRGQRTAGTPSGAPCHQLTAPCRDEWQERSEHTHRYRLLRRQNFYFIGKKCPLAFVSIRECETARAPIIGQMERLPLSDEFSVVLLFSTINLCILRTT